MLTPNSQSIPLPPHSSLATTSLFSKSKSLFLFCRQVHLCPILYSPLNGELYAISLSLSDFTYYENLQLHLSCCKWHSFILFMAEQYPIVHLYHVFLIHLSVGGHIDCFHVLANVNCAAMNIQAPISLTVTASMDMLGSSRYLITSLSPKYVFLGMEQNSLGEDQMFALVLQGSFIWKSGLSFKN